MWYLSCSVSVQKLPSPRPVVDDVDVPADDQRAGLRVEYLENDPLEVAGAEPRLERPHVGFPVVDKLRRIKPAQADDVLEALQDVVRHVGDGVRVGIDGDAGHEPRNPFGSRARVCAAGGRRAAGIADGLVDVARGDARAVLLERGLDPGEIIGQTGQRDAPVALQRIEAQSGLRWRPRRRSRRRHRGNRCACAGRRR